MIGLSGVVLVTTTPGRMGMELVPDLVPFFGVAFALLYLVAQYFLAVYLRNLWAIALVTSVAIVGGLAGWTTRAAGLLGDVATHHSSGVRHTLCMAACVAGAALGYALVKEWISKQDRFGAPS